MLGAVECGVQTAYTVIDEYMRRGREAAGRYREHPNWRDNMNDNRYNYSNPYTAWGPMGPFIAPWMQAMQAWACAMSAFVPGAAPQGSWGQCATSPKVSVRVTAQNPTEVSAWIDPGADGMELTADPLKISGDTVAPLLGPVPIKCECGHVRVSVTVPKGQPAGRYSGAIRDKDGCRRGELTVDISAPL
jgi:hypothetical protein